MGSHLAGYGTLLLRISLGTVFLAHSVLLKFFTYGLGGTSAFFVSAGLPGWLAYVTFVAEAVGGVLLVIGVATRQAALALAPFMLGAAMVVHGDNGWVFDAAGGGWEYPALLAILCLVQSLLGDGAWSLNRRVSKMLRGQAAA